MILRIPDVFEQRAGYCRGGEVRARIGEMPMVLVPGPVATERSRLAFSWAFPPAQPHKIHKKDF